MIPYEDDNVKDESAQSWYWPQTGRFSTLYKYWMLIHCLYVLLVVVIRISFEGKPVFSIVVIEFYIDIVWLIEMIRIFNSPYFNENGKMVYNKRLIAKRYLTSWFILDLYAFVPLAYIRYKSNWEEGGQDK